MSLAGSLASVIIAQAQARRELDDDVGYEEVGMADLATAVVTQRRCLGPRKQLRAKTRCGRCGEPKERSTKRCRSCMREAAHERRLRIVALWAQGASLAEMATTLGVSRSAIGTEMTRARDAGYDLPYRWGDALDDVREAA